MKVVHNKTLVIKHFQTNKQGSISKQLEKIENCGIDTTKRYTIVLNSGNFTQLIMAVLAIR